MDRASQSLKIGQIIDLLTLSLSLTNLKLGQVSITCHFFD